MRYICKRCAYGTNIKCNLINHLNRKNQCKALCLDISRDTLIEELEGKKLNYAENTQKSALGYAEILLSEKDSINLLECEYCKKNFKEKRYLQQHISRNNCKEKDKKEKAKQEEERLKDEEIKLYKEEMALMRKQIELLMIAQKGCNTNIETQNNTNIETQNNTTNIQINGWGHEDTSHLTDKFLRFCYDRPFTSIQRVIEAVYFNPNCPKNWNTMIKDDKSSKALIYDREKDAWLKKETIGILEDLVHTGYSMLDENFDKQRDANKLTDRLIEKFTNFQDFYAKGDKQFEKRLATEIKELLINYKAYHVIK